ncbi:MAG: type II toxin-antitoxin system YoeB family toxin [Bacteroidales bacterium]|nr:type II toxin-antitoxin system YoeB family toxin [Bacteroidales bacterium]
MNRWSRRITDKHRLVYRIFETEVFVEVISAYGHYSDK